jgi:hypothetical protein
MENKRLQNPFKELFKEFGFFILEFLISLVWIYAFLNVEFYYRTACNVDINNAVSYWTILFFILPIIFFVTVFINIASRLFVRFLLKKSGVKTLLYVCVVQAFVFLLLIGYDLLHISTCSPDLG